jgi:MFS family permease
VRPTVAAHPERQLFTSFAVVWLAPAWAHLLWRPLVALTDHDPAGFAPWVTLSAGLLGLVGSLAGSALPTRAAVVGSLALGAALGVLCGGLPAVVALAVVALVSGPTSSAIRTRLPAAFDGQARRRPVLWALWSLAALVAIYRLGNAATYMADPAMTAYASGDSHLVHHLCLTAYLHAAELVRLGVDNVYDLALAPQGGPLAPTAAHMAPFDVDRYGYPPQFLLLPLATTALVPDFAAQRALWFGMYSLGFAAGIWTMARWLDEETGWRLLLSAPLVASFAVVTFVIGNAHLLVVMVALAAMVAVDRDGHRLGGALLAAAILAKISPGILGVVLLMQRRWAAVGWTVAWATLVSAVTLAVVGWGPFDAFLTYHLPRVATGEAYDFLDHDLWQIVNNVSAFGVPFKLHVLGLVDDPWALGPRFASAATVAVFAVAVVGGWRQESRRGQLALWIGLLILGSLRSPYGPAYMVVPALWVLVLLAPEASSGWRRAAWGLAILTVVQHVPAEDDTLLALRMVGSFAMVGWVAWASVRRWPGGPAASEDDRAPVSLSPSSASVPAPSASRGELRGPTGVTARVDSHRPRAAGYST